MFLIFQFGFQFLFLQVLSKALLAFFMPEQREYQGSGNDDQGCEESQEAEPPVFELDVLLGDGESVLRVLGLVDKK